MARPKKPIKRQKFIKVSYTIVEYKFIEKYADIYGLTKAEFVRAKSLKHRLKPKMTLEEADFYRKLIGMANNLNQFAKSAHLGKLMQNQLIKTLEGINATIEKLR